VLVFAQGLVCVAFVFSVGINIAGLGLSTNDQCYAVIRACILVHDRQDILVCCSCNEQSTYADNRRTLFLLERVRIVRAPFVERKRDVIWIGGTILTVCGYLGIMGFEFVAPEADLSRVDGNCRIGIQPGAAVGVIVLDTVFNVVLTVIFIWQLRPAIASTAHQSSSDVNGPIQKRRAASICHLLSLKKHHLGSSGRTSSENSFRAMVMRNITGSALLLLNTIVPNVIFLKWKFARWAHACSLMCLTDSKSTLFDGRVQIY
jgi:hypothetical protein